MAKSTESFTLQPPREARPRFAALMLGHSEIKTSARTLAYRNLSGLFLRMLAILISQWAGFAKRGIVFVLVDSDR